MISRSRFNALHNGLTAVCKKVYASLSDDEYRSAARVGNELVALGIRMDRREIDGCLKSLARSGLAIEESGGLFVKERVKEEPKKRVGRESCEILKKSM